MTNELKNAFADSIRKAIADKAAQWENNNPDVRLPFGMENTLTKTIMDCVCREWTFAKIEAED